MGERTETPAARLARADADLLAEMRELAVDPLGALSAAARGGMDAQRKLALAAWARAVEYDPACNLHFLVSDTETLEAALLFARLAASHGERSDADLLVTMLGIAAELMPCTEADRIGEALGWMQREADAGCEKAARELNILVDHASPEAIAIGKEYLDRLRAHIPHRTELN